MNSQDIVRICTSQRVVDRSARGALRWRSPLLADRSVGGPLRWRIPPLAACGLFVYARSHSFALVRARSHSFTFVRTRSHSSLGSPWGSSEFIGAITGVSTP